MVELERVGIYVDGQNFLRRVAEHFNVSQDRLAAFDMTRFIEYAAGDNRLHIVRKVFFDNRATEEAISYGYVLPFRTAVHAMNRRHGFEINREGEITYARNSKQFSEKGVDVAMALSVYEDVRDGRVKTAVLLTADRDIKPVVRRLEKHDGRAIQIDIEGFHASYLGVNSGNYWYVKQSELAQCMPLSQ